jgi:hypothetical protein
MTGSGVNGASGSWRDLNVHVALISVETSAKLGREPLTSTRYSPSASGTPKSPSPDRSVSPISSPFR